MSEIHSKEYKYDAYDQQGRLRSGQIDALSARDAIQLIHNLGLTPIRVSEGGSKSGLGNFLRILGVTPSVTPSSERFVDFFRLLSILLDAGIAVDEAVKALRLEQRFNRSMNIHIDAIHKEIMDGAPLSQALASQKTLLAPQYINLIAAGEQSGTLKVVLSRLSEHLETASNRKGQIRTALIYPLILIVGAIGTLSVIAIFLTPIIEDVVTENGGNVPPVFVMLNAVRALLTDYFAITASVSLSALLVSVRWFRSKAGIRSLYAVGLRAPLLGLLIRKIETVKFSSLLGLLLQSGVPILNAIDLTGDTLGAPQFRDATAKARDGIAAGGRLMDAQALRDLTPNPTQKMIEVGERTGRLGEVLQKLSEIFDDDVQRFINASVGLITPVLTLLIGGGVGFIIFSVMSAILDLNTLVGT